MKKKTLCFILIMVWILNFCSKKKNLVSEPAGQIYNGKKIKVGEIAEIKKREIGEEIVEITERDLQQLKEIDIHSVDRFYQTGIASWYGGKFHGRRTSNGEVYDMYKLTAAHKTLPFNTIVEVENLENGGRIIVRINDRGPFIKNRIIDLSFKAAKRLGIAEPGLARVGLRVIKTTKIRRYQNQYISGQEYYLQAGAFSKKGNAERILKKIKGIQSEIVFSIIVKDGYFKIISEKMSTRSRAERLKRRLDDFNVDAFIKDYL